MIPGVAGISQAASALSNLALVTPLQSYGYAAVGAFDGVQVGPGWLFTIEGENTVELSAEVSKNYRENNSFVNQTIAISPPTITVHGFKGEVENINPPFGTVGQVAQAVLAVVGDFQPSFSASAQNVINQAAQAYQEAKLAANAAVSAWNTLAGNTGATVITPGGILSQNPNQNNQQALFSQIYGYWLQQVDPSTPVLFNVQTPWAIFTPCALVKVRALQDETTDEVTDFFLTFELVFFESDASGTPVAAGRAAASLNPGTNNGTVTPSNANSLLTQLQVQGLP